MLREPPDSEMGQLSGDAARSPAGPFGLEAKDEVGDQVGDPPQRWKQVRVLLAPHAPPVEDRLARHAEGHGGRGDGETVAGGVPQNLEALM